MTYVASQQRAQPRQRSLTAASCTLTCRLTYRKVGRRRDSDGTLRQHLGQTRRVIETYDGRTRSFI
eukprot:scaffold1080_cov195-Cylindrotheca_fusiformis.AAC.6